MKNPGSGVIFAALIIQATICPLDALSVADGPVDQLHVEIDLEDVYDYTISSSAVAFETTITGQLVYENAARGEVNLEMTCDYNCYFSIYPVEFHIGGTGSDPFDIMLKIVNMTDEARFSITVIGEYKEHLETYTDEDYPPPETAQIVVGRSPGEPDEQWDRERPGVLAEESSVDYTPGIIIAVIVTVVCIGGAVFHIRKSRDS